jgi:hypothetical protein
LIEKKRTMALIDTIKKHCPYCGLEGSIKQFLGWEKADRRGFQGQTEDGALILLCPRCHKKIRYDIQINKFLAISGEQEHVIPKGAGMLPWLTGSVSFFGSVYLLLAGDEWWQYFFGAALFVYGWTSIKSGLKGNGKVAKPKFFRRPPFKEAERNAKNGL